MPFLRWVPLALVGLFALWLRLGDLDRRPMHADEANQAVKFGELLENGRYTFDPRDHHGPTLYYAALPVAWLRGERTLAALSETTLRLVPVLFGTAAVALLGMLALPLGRWPAVAAAGFLAASPPAVYYSRYFIQETLLLTFTLGTFVCAQQWCRERKLGWAIGTGVCLGLMQATKATAPLFLVAALVAVTVGRALARPREPVVPQGGLKPALLCALAAALFTAALLYSSFFTNVSGLRDAFGTYTHALTRFGGEAPPTGHEKPWWYYLRLFGWLREGGIVWQQLGFSSLACAGLVIAFASPKVDDDLRAPSVLARAADPTAPGGRHPLLLLRSAAVYTLLIVAAFSFFALKLYSPWQSIHFVPGMALLAAGALAAIARLRTGKFVAVPLALLVCVSQFNQVKLSSYVRPADVRNPYAYVHSASDVLKYRALAEAALARSPDQPVRVISEEYWPLPWYFRGLPRIGYWSTPPDDCDGALVITSMSEVEAVRARLRGNYRESILGLRPGFLCIVFTPES